jgi:hypothetical protein
MGTERRFKRKMERDIKKDIKKNGDKFNVPSEQQIKDYIYKKATELKIINNDGTETETR